MARICLIGPTHPYRGGIAHYTTLLARHLRQEHELLFISFSRQYPKWLFPGPSDLDPSQRPLREEAEYLLDPLNPISWQRSLRRIQAWAPQLVVIPWWVPFWAPAWGTLARRIKRLPSKPGLVFICHNVLPHEEGRLDRLAVRWALGPGDGFLVHSQADSRLLRKMIPTAEIRVTPIPTYGPLGVEATDALPVTLPADRPILLFCGFVRPYKGLDILLDAMPVVLTNQPVHLLVAGEFWQSDARYRAQIEHLDLADSVTLVNRYLPNELLAAFVLRSDVVVLPYRSASQSAIVQLAFGLGRPIITTDVGGLAEMVDNERTGLIVPPEDSRALASAINRFFDEGLADRFAANIRQEQHRFSWQHLVDMLAAFIPGQQV